MERKRAEERAQLRHKNKGKYAKLLKRYAGNDAAQEAYKNLNFQRKEIIHKLKEMAQQVEEIEESSYDEENEAIEDLNEIIDQKESNKDDNLIDKIIS